MNHGRSIITQVDRSEKIIIVSESGLFVEFTQFSENVVLTVLNSFLRRSYLVSTNVTSA